MKNIDFTKSTPHPTHHLLSVGNIVCISHSKVVITPLPSPPHPAPTTNRHTFSFQVCNGLKNIDFTKSTPHPTHHLLSVGNILCISHSKVVITPLPSPPHPAPTTNRHTFSFQVCNGLKNIDFTKSIPHPTHHLLSVGNILCISHSKVVITPLPSLPHTAPTTNRHAAANLPGVQHRQDVTFQQ